MEIKAAIDKQLDKWEWNFSNLTHSESLDLQERLSTQLTQMGVVHSEKWTLAARNLHSSAELIHQIAQERLFRKDLQYWKQYQHWKSTRHPGRAALEEKFGYDTKHAAHLVRLLRMGLEILEQGQCIVWRGDRDAQELLAIRAGAWSYDELIAWTQSTQKKMDDIYRHKNYVVPDKPERQAVERICQQLLLEALSQ